MKYYISDYHIGHSNVIRMDQRPFADCTEMAAEIVRRWNAVITPADEVYILGDFAWKNTEGDAVLQQLCGRKHLITGNHDKPSQVMRSRFEGIQDYAEIEDSGSMVVLSHYPIAHWNHQFQGAVHLYGHVHNNPDYAAFLHYRAYCKAAGIPFTAFNVGCMLGYMDYTPRTLEYLMHSVF